uniref:RNA helicase n=1 Tax=Strigamia maritima TaxID=126957 RepID=T1JES8_STRMM
MTKTKGNKDVCVGEDLRIAVTLTLQKFRLTEEQKEYEFPSSLTSLERAFIHGLALDLGLKSKSRGKGANRFLTVYKKEGSTIVQADAVFQLARVSRQHIISLLQRFPVTNKERQELLPLTERDRLLPEEGHEINRTTGRLNNGIPQVPPPRGHSELNSFRESLPVWKIKDEVINTIEQNQIVLVSGDTGCGKTTQIPQFILDTYQAKNKPCRIICTQPRRISALTIAERVALERDEKIGQTIGYQIRLESRVSPKTLLTFCTNGVLLRTLIGGDSALATVTHVIVDEIHERDRFSDFLLIILRDCLAKFRNLKLVLMSAVLDIQLFVKYFNGCPVISIPGSVHDVQELFLEDILKCTGFTSKSMMKYKSELDKMKNQSKSLIDWCNMPVLPSTSSDQNKKLDVACDRGAISPRTLDMISEKIEPEPWLAAEMDQCISKAWLAGSEEAFTQLMNVIMTENVSVDYQHSETSATPLMVAAGRGCLNTVEQLLNLGANINVRASNDWTALDWGHKFNNSNIVELLEAHITACEASYSDTSELIKLSKDTHLTEEDKELLNIYHHGFDDEKVDIDLIMCLLYKIHTSQEEGAVLIFLPGYDEIVGLRDRILCDDKRFADTSKFILYTLHSNMQSVDQKKVFKNPPQGIRKIILATNIAETSVTINDVVFVIDSGKVKEKSYDALTGVSTLKAVWISKASSVQRKGRSGRCQPGLCYHLFSRIRFRYLQEFQQPEILRFPLQELCLNTKLLAPPNTPIADFLSKAPDPPAFMVTRNAVQLLKTIDALDPWEDLTELGHHLLDLPIEPRLGKMVLYSVVLKCLDPILTIVCALAYRDPFVLPAQPSQKRASAIARKKLAAGTYSDHMSLLRAFQAWQKARSDGWERAFCEKNFLSAATMEIVVGMRTQLLGQLRASGFVRARGGGDIRDLNSNSENWAVVKAALCAGTYPNLIRVDRERIQLMTQKESKVRFHPSTVLSELPKSARTSVASSHSQVVESLPSDWLIYEEMTRAGRLAHVRCCTLITPITIALFAGPARLPHDAVTEADSGARGDGYQDNDSDSEFEEKNESQKAMLKIDDWVSFRVDSEAVHLALQLRQKWHSLFLRRMRAPSKPWSQVDEAVVRTIINILSSEEQALGLQQPLGIGQRPRPMATDYFSSTPATTGMRRTSGDINESMEDFVPQESNRFAPRPQNQPFVSASSPKKKESSRFSRGSDERSDSSSIRSTSSICGSTSISPCPSPTGCAEKESLLACSSSGGSCRYYIIKSNSQKMIEVSLIRGVWAFTPSTERKLQKTLKEGKILYLIFSVQGSGHFQGYAHLTCDLITEKISEFSAPNLGQVYRIEWIKRANVPFQSTRHLQNPWNENRKIQISRDGQEVEPSVGEALCKLWDKVPSFVPKCALLSHMKDQCEGRIDDDGANDSHT